MIPIQQEPGSTSLFRSEYPRVKKQLVHLGKLTDVKFKSKKHSHMANPANRHPLDQTADKHSLPNQTDLKLNHEIIKNKIKQNLLAAQMISIQERARTFRKAAPPTESPPKIIEQQKPNQSKLTKAEHNLKKYLLDKVERLGKISAPDEEFLREVCLDELSVLLANRADTSKTSGVGQKRNIKAITQIPTRKQEDPEDLSDEGGENEDYAVQNDPQNEQQRNYQQYLQQNNLS